MADDYDNTDDIQNMSDGELRAYILSQLASQKSIDVTDVNVQVQNGKVRLDGRVGTEEELRIIDHVATDLTGLTEIDNQIVVDEIRRAESPEAIDDHIVDEVERSGLMLGDMVLPVSPEEGHLADASEFEKDLLEEGLADVSLLEDEDAGTHDVQEAIEGGKPWIPPEGPTPEGVSGQEDGNFGIDGQR